jgi:hypothetical protein
VVLFARGTVGAGLGARPGRRYNPRVTRLPIALLLACATVASATAADDAEKQEIVHRATLYVHRFIDNFTYVVAEERYVQEATRPKQKRTLRSNVLLVRNPGAPQWHWFRDVIEVDGQPVHDGRESRLAELFSDLTSDSLRRAQEIVAAGTRHNVRNIGTVNNPLFAMSFLQRDYTDRFRFIPGGIEKKLGPTVRSIRFEETRTPTLLTQEGNRDLPARGLVWVDEETGRVVKTELKLGEHPINMRSSLGWQPPVTITTMFGFDQELGIDVPVEMRDRYPQDRDDIRGVATYGSFRRIRVRGPSR